MPEEGGRKPGDCLALFERRRAFREHRGGGGDVAHIGRTIALFQAARQHRHIRSLTPPIGVQLIKHQKLQHVVAEQRLVFAARHQQLAHHVVGEQNLRGLLAHLLTRLLRSLARVFGETHGERLAIALLVLLLQAFQRTQLGVDQRVHRIHNQRDHPLMRVRIAQQVVDNGNQVGKAFARSGAAGDHEAASGVCESQGALLMGEQLVGRAVGSAEDARDFGM